ncbi:helix-turn-helix domain-containing protein [Solibacillus sp. FSL H8-0523]|uniref:helix-turn-helix domain-containing protein n=1 Tax=Solibacillus sp. FSL H8-0523 TaxID=2954511 RepID=UPI0031016D34
MAEQHNRAFKGVWISKEIWLAKDLGWSEKLLLVEIDSLDGEQGCFASNEYLANFFGLSKDRISKMVSSLKNKGYISVQVFYKEGTKQIEKRVIRVNRQPYPIGENADTLAVKTTRGIGENNYTPIGENAEDNNTVINNTTNNTNKDKDRQSSVSPLTDTNFVEIKEAFEANVRTATFKDVQEIDDAMNVYEPALILEAIKAGASNARSFKYIVGILDNWRLEFKVKTYADWQQKIQSKGGSSNGGNQRGNGQQPSFKDTFGHDVGF